jgi:hypothetical protein
MTSQPSSRKKSKERSPRTPEEAEHIHSTVHKFIEGLGGRECVAPSFLGKKETIVAIILSTPRPTTYVDLEKKGLSIESCRHALAEIIAMNLSLVSPDRLDQYGLPELKLRRYVVNKVAHWFVDFPDLVMSEIDEKLTKALKRLGGERPTSRLPYHDELAKDYKSRIVSSWQTIWFSHLYPEELLSPFLERKMVPANEAARRRYSDPQSPAELLAHEDAVVLLGDLGAGKSHATAKLAVDCAMGGLLPGYLPLYIPLSEFSGKKDLRTLCREAVQAVLGTFISKGSETSADSLARKSQMVFCGLDGLERLTEQYRTKLLSQVASLLQKRSHKFVIACREHALTEHIQHIPAFTFTALVDEQIIAYLRYFTGISCDQVFTNEIRPNARIYLMAQVPFMLSRMGLLLGSFKNCKLPCDPSGLLELFVELMPPDEVDFRLRVEKNFFLTEIAFFMVNRLGGTYRCYRRSLRGISLGHPRYRPTHSAEQLFRAACDDFLLKTNAFNSPTSQIEFSHELLRDAYAAVVLSQLLMRENGECNSEILMHCALRPKWETSLFLAFGNLLQNEREQVLTILRTVKPKLVERIEHTYL